MNSHLHVHERTRDIPGHPVGIYQPSSAEIAAMCRLIQDEWSENERRARQAGSRLMSWTVHEVRWMLPE